jgi:hypothetical protein
MKTSPHFLFCGLAALSVSFLTSATGQAAATLVPLGTAGGFGVLAGTEITVTGPTTIRGDAGTTSGTGITGLTSLSLTGTNHGGDAVTLAAQLDLTTAWMNALLQPADFNWPAISDLGGQTLTPGVHRGLSSLAITGNLTLNGGGDSESVWIFHAFSTLTTASNANIILTNGAQASNILWVAGSSATLGTGSHLQGNLLAVTNVTLTTGATVEGGVYARNGAVTLDTNVAGIPEPMSTLLAAAGLLGTMLHRRR